MTSLQAVNIDDSRVLSKALRAAGKELGMTQAALGAVVGRDRTGLGRPIDPASKTGELALLLLRCHRGLYVLVGGDPKAMKHWMHTENRHTGGVPAEQVKQVQGLNRVVEYLDAMRGKL